MPIFLFEYLDIQKLDLIFRVNAKSCLDGQSIALNCSGMGV
jgi:hypothetical protein